MSVRMLLKAMTVRDVSSNERLVLLSLADCADNEGRNAFRSESTIADHMQISVRTVKRCLQSLKIRGLLVVQELPTSRRSTTYQVFPGDASSDTVTPRENKERGVTVAPRMDKLSPVGVTRGVTPCPVRGDKRGSAYKEEPVFEPDDPAVLNLVTKFAAEILSKDPHCSEMAFLDSLRRAVNVRGIPYDLSTLTEAMTRARRQLSA